MVNTGTRTGIRDRTVLAFEGVSATPFPGSAGPLASVPV